MLAPRRAARATGLVVAWRGAENAIGQTPGFTTNLGARARGEGLSLSTKGAGMNDLAKMKCDVAGTPEGVRVVVTLLGPFTIGLGGKWAGPWPRPPAKRLCELLMLRPRHRIFRDVARELLFANLAPEASANALRKAVSMARQALLPLAPVGPGFYEQTASTSVFRATSLWRLTWWRMRLRCIRRWPWSPGTCETSLYAQHCSRTASF